jgi:ATP-dependent helicase HrpA
VSAFRAVVDTGSGVEARLVDTAAEAERLTNAGMMRLFVIKNEKLLRTQVKNLPQWNAAALSLGAILPASALQAGIRDLLARIAFIENQPAVKDSSDFDARQSRASVLVTVATQEVAGWLPVLGSSYQELRLGLEKAPRLWSEVIDSIRLQLADLFALGFLQEVPWQWLKEYPRYLQAARIRLEKLTSGGLPKDRKLSEPLIAARAAYRQATQSKRMADPQFVQQVTELRWLIEEFQVSIFSQQLGTKVTVSPKRIQQALQSLN